jgi:hypothetical protein
MICVRLHQTFFIVKGLISCQFLPPGGSIGTEYNLQLLFSERSQNFSIIQQPLKLEKNRHSLGYHGILEFFKCI